METEAACGDGIWSMPSADSIITIWFKLLILAGKQNNDGVFMMSNKLPFTDEMLATIFRRDLNTVRLALKTFEEFGMIEVVDNVITIPNWNKHQTLDAYEKKKERDRLYQQNRRKKQKNLIEQKSLDKSSDVAVSDKEEEKEEDKEKENIKENSLSTDSGDLFDFVDLSYLERIFSKEGLLDYLKKDAKKKIDDQVLLHQSIIGLEAKTALDKYGIKPDVIIGCAGGGSNLGGLIAPFMGQKLRGEADYRFIAVEPASCPSLTRGKYVYDFCDTGMVCPLAKMYTLGSGFIPSANHAGGLRYHGMSSVVSELYDQGLMEARSVEQTAVFAAAEQFARTEGILPAPER